MMIGKVAGDLYAASIILSSRPQAKSFRHGPHRSHRRHYAC
jgi:hypothetical protein